MDKANVSRMRGCVSKRVKTQPHNPQIPVMKKKKVRKNYVESKQGLDDKELISKR